MLMIQLQQNATTDDSAFFFAFMGVASALVFASKYNSYTHS